MSSKYTKGKNTIDVDLSGIDIELSASSLSANVSKQERQKLMRDNTRHLVGLLVRHDHLSPARMRDLAELLLQPNLIDWQATVTYRKGEFKKSATKTDSLLHILLGHNACGAGDGIGEKILRHIPNVNQLSADNKHPIWAIQHNSSNGLMWLRTLVQDPRVNLEAVRKPIEGEYPDLLSELCQVHIARSADPLWQKQKKSTYSTWGYVGIARDIMQIMIDRDCVIDPELMQYTTLKAHLSNTFTIWNSESDGLIQDSSTPIHHMTSPQIRHIYSLGRLPELIAHRPDATYADMAHCLQVIPDVFHDKITQQFAREAAAMTARSIIQSPAQHWGTALAPEKEGRSA